MFTLLNLKQFLTKCYLVCLIHHVYKNAVKATSINYFFARNKYNEQDASLPRYDAGA